MNQPLVSVGIPCYNRPDGLRNTLESITNQTYKNIEIIISDNYSPDLEVKRIGKSYAKKDKRIRYIRQEKNKGISFNFRYVLDQANGEYFMWAADDDEWDLTFIEQCIDSFNISKNIVLVATGCDCYNSKNEYSYKYDILNTIGLNTIDRFKKYIGNVYHNELRVAALIHGIFKKELMFDISFVDIIAYDFVFMSEICFRGEILSIDKTLIKKTRDRGKKYISKNKLSNRYPYLVLSSYIIKNIIKSKISIIEKGRVIIYIVYLYFNYKLKIDIRYRR